MASTSSYLADRTLKIGSKVIPWDVRCDPCAAPSRPH